MLKRIIKKGKNKKELYGMYDVLVLHMISYAKLAGFVNPNEVKPLQLLERGNNVFCSFRYLMTRRFEIPVVNIIECQVCFGRSVGC